MPLRPFSASSALRFLPSRRNLGADPDRHDAAFGHAQELPRAKSIAKRVMCMCGGCQDSAGMCSHPGGTFSGPCETARAMQKDLDVRVGRNESDDAILTAYVQQYGPTVLVEPPKKGFDLLAWIMPVVAAADCTRARLASSPTLAAQSGPRSRRRPADRSRIAGARRARSEQGTGQGRG